MAPSSQGTAVTFGPICVCPGTGAACGTKAHHELHWLTTGRVGVRPTRNCRIALASWALTAPFPVVSAARICAGVSERRPTMYCKIATASPAERALPGPAAKLGRRVACVPLLTLRANEPSAAVAVVETLPSVTVTPGTPPPASWYRIVPEMVTALAAEGDGSGV